MDLFIALQIRVEQMEGVDYDTKKKFIALLHEAAREQREPERILTELQRVEFRDRKFQKRYITQF